MAGEYSIKCKKLIIFYTAVDIYNKMCKTLNKIYISI